MQNSDKWRPVSLKSSWYDDHFGFDAHASEVVENRIRLLDARFLRNDEEGLASASVQRFFDLFEKSDVDVGS